MSARLVLPCLWALSAAAFSAVALGRLRRAASRARSAAPPRASGPPPPVLLLRPLDAPSPAELQALAHPVDYAGALVHVVLAPERPPLPAGVRWLLSDPTTPNRKVGHLRHALQSLAPVPGQAQGRAPGQAPGQAPDDARRWVVLTVDADVAVTGALVEALARPVAAGAALCSAAWRPVGARGAAALALQGLLRNTHHSFLALHAMSAGAPTLSGKALALSQETARLLCELGEHIGEDLELARLLHAAGQGAALAAVPAQVPLPEPLSPHATLARIARWMQVLHSHRPALYPTVPLLFAPTLPLLLLALMLGAPALSLCVLGLVGVRCALSLRLASLSRLPQEREGFAAAAFGWMAGEALLLLGFLASLPGLLHPRVRWRGRSYLLSSGGRMTPLPAAAPRGGVS